VKTKKERIKMKKKLYRSNKNKIIGGVCGGLGEYFEIDPVLIRVLFVFLTFFHGSGLLLYLLLLIIVPKEPILFTESAEEVTSESIESTTDETSEVFRTNRKDSRKIFGIILLVLGVIFLLDNLLPAFDFEITFPLILILIGAYLLYESFRNQRGAK
jgi:phage shock protein PspC (stress-responsive transcriptional regulator)